MKNRRFLSIAAILFLVVALLPAQIASAAATCSITYTNRNDWGNGATIDVTITNTGPTAINGWTLDWIFPGNQTITNLWNGSYAQSGASVSVTNLSYNASIPANGGTTNFGFNLNYRETNAAPTAFVLNGATCGGGGATKTSTRTSTPAFTYTRTFTPTGPTSTVTRTPTRTNTPKPTSTVPPGTHVNNPFVGATWYINPDYAAQVRAAAAAKGGTLGAQMAAVANYNTAVWLDRIAAVTGGIGVTRSLAGHLDSALSQGANLIVIVVYDLPNRDCAASASNGELLVAQDGLNKYKTQYIDPMANILSDAKYTGLRIVAIIEPDSLPNLVTNLSKPLCAEANSSGAYVQGVQYAINTLHKLPNVYAYIDIAHSGWLGWDSNFGPAVDQISNTVKGTTAGVNSIDGFVSNTANYTPVEELFLPDSNLSVGGQPVKSAAFYEWNPYFDERDYATAMYNAFVSRGFPSSIGMLIDTSRNGWGGPNRPTDVSTSADLNVYVNASRLDRRAHRGNWCNQAGGIGPRPQANPLPHFDAFVWIKPPGESDGTSNRTQKTPDAEGKRFDAMCDPNGQSTYNSSYPTGALASAPASGRWFEAGFESLVRNAYPPFP